MLLERLRAGGRLLSCDYKTVLEKYLTAACNGASGQCQVAGSVTHCGSATWRLTSRSLSTRIGHTGKHNTRATRLSSFSQCNGLTSTKPYSPPCTSGSHTGSCMFTNRSLRTISGCTGKHPQYLGLPKRSLNTWLSSSSALTGNGFTSTHHHLLREHQCTGCFKAVTKQGHNLALLYNQRSPYVSQTEGICWNCQKHVRIELFFCANCKAIQPPDPTKDFFQIMDSDRTFTVEIQKLQERYRNLQRLLHPDFFSQKSQKERDLSEMQSSLVNKAYRTLLTPLSRGLYLLQLNGINVGEGTDSDVEMPLIFEIMELNEKLEEARDQAEIQDIGNFVEAKYEELTEDVGKAFEKGDFKEAKLLLIQMKYFSNIQEKVKIKNMPS